jgi:hypothetical protein
VLTVGGEDRNERRDVTENPWALRLEALPLMIAVSV